MTAAAAERLPAQLHSQKSVTGSIQSSLISSPVPLQPPQGQLPPTLGPVIYWASLRCLWLPSGCLSGLRFSQTAASLQIIIELRPAVWRSSTGSLLLIELDPDAGSDGENEQSSPSEPCDRSTQTEEVKSGLRGPVCFEWVSATYHIDCDFVRCNYTTCFSWGQARRSVRVTATRLFCGRRVSLPL